MKRLDKKKESKVTIKTHHKHHPIHKDEMKQVQGGMSSFQALRSASRKKKDKD